jgi:hypothetical protein
VYPVFFFVSDMPLEYKFLTCLNVLRLYIVCCLISLLGKAYFDRVALNYRDICVYLSFLCISDSLIEIYLVYLYYCEVRDQW